MGLNIGGNIKSIYFGGNVKEIWLGTNKLFPSGEPFPEGFTKIEYAYCSSYNTQNKLDIPIALKNNVELTLKFMGSISVPGSNQYLYICYSGSAGSIWFLHASSSANKIYSRNSRYGSESEINTTESFNNDTTEYKLVSNGNVIKIFKGEETILNSSFNYSYWSNDLTKITLFFNGVNWFKIGTINIGDIVLEPCIRNADGKVGFLKMNDETFYTNNYIKKFK